MHTPDTPQDAPRVALLGDPVAHSLSPVFQNAGFRALGLPHRYVALHTPASALPDRLDALRTGRLVGANVTVPHKEAVAQASGLELSEEARLLGAVNTLGRAPDGRLWAHNTDVEGCARALAECAWARDVSAGAAIVWGAGGSARAVMLALARLGVRRLHVVNRTESRAARLVASMRDPLASVAGDVECSTSGWPEAAARRAPVWREARVWVQCTSLGVGAALGSAEHTRACQVWERAPWAASAGLRGVMDLCYGRSATPFVAVARAQGVPAIDGLSMLLYQGVASFQRWTGREAPEGAMRAALERAARGEDSAHHEGEGHDEP